MDRARVGAAIRRAQELADETRHVIHVTRNERYLAALLREAVKRQRAQLARASSLARMLGHENLPLQS